MLSAASCHGFCGRARPPGGRLIQLKRASRHGQAPSRRLALPGASCTLWYLCLRFHILHSRALPRGSSRGHVCSRAWQGRVWSSSSQPSGCCLPTPASRCSLSDELWELKKLGKDEGLQVPPLRIGFCWRPSMLMLCSKVRDQQVPLPTLGLVAQYQKGMRSVAKCLFLPT
ncbi:hypothetical protein HJG60_011927 [Phyllostomus discolor]|uniref:Uncharacterized protein n=1 Tax=Phyllostomus discolor TaxID=89673 RepID=A0A833ZLT2_9CHIR|nr:hypothetical protein HJG60_011927 [Phyllostomus discolor]